MLAACAFGDRSCLDAHLASIDQDFLAAINSTSTSWLHCLAVVDDSELPMLLEKLPENSDIMVSTFPSLMTTVSTFG